MCNLGFEVQLWPFVILSSSRGCVTPAIEERAVILNVLVKDLASIDGRRRSFGVPQDDNRHGARQTFSEQVLRSIWPRACKHRSFASTLRMTTSDLVAAE